jgi:hypothetical protein
MSSKHEREMKRQEKARLEDMADVISTDQGKRVIWGILEICGVSSKNMNITPELMARQEGARSVGLDIQTWATMSAPHHVMKMIQDNAEKIGLLEQEDEDEQD